MVDCALSTTIPEILSVILCFSSLGPSVLSDPCVSTLQSANIPAYAFLRPHPCLYFQSIQFHLTLWLSGSEYCLHSDGSWVYLALDLSSEPQTCVYMLLPLCMSTETSNGMEQITNWIRSKIATWLLLQCAFLRKEIEILFTQSTIKVFPRFFFLSSSLLVNLHYIWCFSRNSGWNLIVCAEP